MIRFTTLTIKNFLSYGAEPTVITLDRPGTTLILGEDLDNTASGSGANGVGKSVIINALTYGVYDKPVSNISKDNLVNNINKKHMEVVVEFSKGDSHYRIRRVRKSKSYAAGNYVELFENGIDITPDSVSNTNKKIEEIMGLPYELFVRIVVFSATHTPFLDLPVRSQTGPNQTDIIEELFDLKTLSHKAKVLSDELKDTNAEITNLQEKNTIREGEHERLAKQIESAEKRITSWENGRDADIEKLTKKLAKISNIDIEAEKAIRDQLQGVKSELKELNSQVRVFQREISASNKTKDDKQKEISHLRDDKCPYCLQDYEGAVTKIQEAEQQLEEIATSTAEYQDGLDLLLDEIEQLEHKEAELQGQLTIDDLNELIDIESKASDYERQITELTAASNPFIEPLEELKNTVIPKVEYDEVDQLIKNRDHMKFLQKLLTRKDSFVRRVLLNKTLPFLNQRLQHYLSLLGLTHQVEFTHEMTASISQFGRLLDFGNLSNGQRARVNIALSFAFRDVLQSMHERINICLLDEVLDMGLDSIGVTAAARMLKHKAREEDLSLYIISHRDEIDSAFDNTLTVQLKEGFSRIMDGENA